MNERQMTPEDAAQQLKQLVALLRANGRNDLLLHAIGASVLEELRLEMAKTQLSRLLITKDYRFILIDDNHKEIDLTPVHKAVYLLFLNHPEGIEFKKLSEYRDELLHYYMATARLMDKQAIEKSVDMLVNPFNNSINEKCSRIKQAFLREFDDSIARNYYITGGRGEAKKIVLPQEMVIWD